MRPRRGKGDDVSTRRRPEANSGNAPVFSYRASRSRTDTPTGRYELPKQRRGVPTWIMNLPSYIALLVIVGCIGYATTLSNSPRIQIYSNGQTNLALRSTATYQQAAYNLLGSSVLNNTKPTIDTSHVADALKRQFPELSAVSVNVPLIDRQPIIELAIAPSRLILNTRQGNFVISDSGIALVQTDRLPAGTIIKVPTVTDQTGLQIKAGDLALTPDSVNFIQVVTAELAAQKLSVQAMTLPAVPQELDVRLTGQAYYLKFNLLNDARQQVGAYLAIKQLLDSSHITPNQYVDLRVDERAYYK